MSQYSWAETLVTAQAAGTALTNSTTATALLPVQAQYTLPAGFFTTPGKQLKILLAGSISNVVTTPGTLTLDVRFNSTPIVVFNGGAMQMSSTAHTTVPFMAEILLTCRAVGTGTSANLIGQGRITSQALSLTAVADSTTTPATLLIPNTTPAVGTGFDSTVANLVQVFGTFSIANAANAVQIQQYSLIALN
jgi:hypothetical protein